MMFSISNYRQAAMKVEQLFPFSEIPLSRFITVKEVLKRFMRAGAVVDDLEKFEGRYGTGLPLDLGYKNHNPHRKTSTTQSEFRFFRDSLAVELWARKLSTKQRDYGFLYPYRWDRLQNLGFDGAVSNQRLPRKIPKLLRWLKSPSHKVHFDDAKDV